MTENLIEIDMYSVIKQKYIERDVLDRIREEIAEYKDDNIIHEQRNEMIDIVLDIIDKNKAERSGEE